MNIDKPDTILSCLSHLSWPELFLVMPTGGGKDNRMVRSSSSPSLTCQWTCPQTTTAKTGQKRATGQNGPKSCYRQLGLLDNATGHNQWGRNLNGDTVFSCSMPARCCDWNHFWNNLVWDLPSGKYFQILEDRILLHFGNRSLACSVTQAEEKFCNRLKLAPLQIEICKRVFRNSGMKFRRQRIYFLTSFRKQDSIMADR